MSAWSPVVQRPTLRYENALRLPLVQRVLAALAGLPAMSPRGRTIKVETRTVQGAPVIHVRGVVDLTTSPLLRDALLDNARRTTGPVLVDLSQVPYMDSSGVGTMVYLKRAGDRAGREVVLIGLQPRVRSVFEITHLDRFFRMANDVGDALHRPPGAAAE